MFRFRQLLVPCIYVIKNDDDNDNDNDDDDDNNNNNNNNNKLTWGKQNRQLYANQVHFFK